MHATVIHCSARHQDRAIITAPAAKEQDLPASTEILRETRSTQALAQEAKNSAVAILPRRRKGQGCRETGNVIHVKTRLGAQRLRETKQISFNFPEADVNKVAVKNLIKSRDQGVEFSQKNYRYEGELNEGSISFSHVLMLLGGSCLRYVLLSCH